MKNSKFLIFVIAGFVIIAFLVQAIGIGSFGFNKQLIDFNYKFNYALVTHPDGEELIQISSWTDFEDGDQIQFTSVDGVTYLTHSSRVILMSKVTQN